MKSIKGLINKFDTFLNAPLQISQNSKAAKWKSTLSFPYFKNRYYERWVNYFIFTRFLKHANDLDWNNIINNQHHRCYLQYYVLFIHLNSKLNTYTKRSITKASHVLTCISCLFNKGTFLFYKFLNRNPLLIYENWK